MGGKIDGNNMHNTTHFIGKISMQYRATKDIVKNSIIPSFMMIVFSLFWGGIR